MEGNHKQKGQVETLEAIGPVPPWFLPVPVIKQEVSYAEKTMLSGQLMGRKWLRVGLM